MKWLFATFFACAAGTASAQEQCFPSRQVYETLEQQFGETRQVAGFTRDMGAHIEVWGNEETGTFTILVSLPSGVSCIVVEGIGYTEYQGPPNA